MNLRTVTISGADDAVNPSDLAALARQYPFLELGILLSVSRQGKEPRYPSAEWLLRLAGVCDQKPMSLSAHLCGGHVRAVCAGDWTLWYGALTRYFDRCQINFAHQEQPLAWTAFVQGLQRQARKNWQIIFQVRVRSNVSWVEMARGAGVNAVPLFDSSGGEGRTPLAWPKAFMPYCGYAGGLTPDNLDAELARIAAVAGDCPIWIDTESGVRTDDRFDLTKVGRFLEIASKYVTTT